MNIKSLRWQDIYNFFPSIHRQEFFTDYSSQEILKEMASYLNHPITSADVDYIINSLRNSTNLEETTEKLKNQYYGFDVFLLSSIRKTCIPQCSHPNFKNIVIQKALKPFFTNIISNLDVTLLDTICEETYECFLEAYQMDKNHWIDYNPRITSIVLSRIMPQICSKLSRHANPYLFSYASHLRKNLSYWHENQYLYEKSHNLPISDPQNSIAYKMFGTTNKPEQLNLQQMNELMEICGAEPLTLEEYTLNRQKEDKEVELINQERQQYLTQSK